MAPRLSVPTLPLTDIQRKAISLIVVSLLVIASLGVIFTFTSRPATAGAPNTYYDMSWTFCRELWIQSSYVEVDFTSSTWNSLDTFIVDIEIDFSTIPDSRTQDDGGDIVFADPDGNKFYHEIDGEFNETSTNIFHINVGDPQDFFGDGTTNKSIFMYYGNPECANQWDVANTWEQHFYAVYHFNETSSGTIYDATSNNRDGTTHNYDGDEFGTGTMGGAHYFHGDEWIEFPDLGFPNDDSVIVTTWVKNADADEHIYDKQYDASDTEHLLWETPDGNAQWVLMDSSRNQYYCNASQGWSDGWNMISQQINDATGSGGALLMTLSENKTTLKQTDRYDEANPYYFDPYTSNSNTGLGVNCTGWNSFESTGDFTGAIDEIRFQKSLYGSYEIGYVPEYRNTTFNFQSDPAGAVEISGVNAVPDIHDPSPVNEDRHVSMQPTVNVTVTETLGTPCECDFYTSDDGSTWTHQQHNSSVLNESISYHYTSADKRADKYYWKVAANNSDYNVTETYWFITSPYNNVSNYWNDSFYITTFVKETNTVTVTGNSYANFTVWGGVETLDFEDYSDGDTASVIDGWYAGSDCGTCEVDNSKSHAGSNCFYQNVNTGDDWQDCLRYDLPVACSWVNVSGYYWESSSNHDGNFWVEAADGTKLCGIGTENPQFEAVTDAGGEVINDGSGADYGEWTYVEMVINCSANEVTFYFNQNNGDKIHTYDTYTLTSSSDKKVASFGVGPDAVWYVDDIRIDTGQTITEGNITSVNITKETGMSWDTLNVDINNTANSTFSILDQNGTVQLSGLDGNNNDISSVTNNTIQIYGEFNGSCGMDSWNVSWKTGVTEAWNTVDEWSGTLQPPSSIMLSGLTDGRITWQGKSGQTVYCNATGLGHETINASIVIGTQSIGGVSVWHGDLNDTGETIGASNISLYASVDNTTWHSFGAFSNGGSNISLNADTWTWADDPFTITADDNIYLRFSLTFPSGLMSDDFYSVSSTSGRIYIST